MADTTATEVIPPPVVPATQPPRRVLLKLSGEVFGGGAVGVDP
jgi:uridylate kinase